MNIKQQRVAYWDNLKGLLILLVVIGHFFYDLRNNTTLFNMAMFIYVFHMPAFVFVSGFFSNDEINWSRLKKLFIFYLIGNTFLMWFSYAFFGTEINLLEPYYSFWYLLALIIWRISITKLGNIKYILPISIVITLLIGSFQEINNTLTLSRIICFFPFFILGYKIKDTKYCRIIKKKSFLAIFFALIVLAYVVLIMIFFIPNITFDELLMYPYVNFGNIINRLMILVLAFLMILFLLIVTPKNKIIFLNKIGRNSLYIFIFHRVIVLIFTNYWNYSFNTAITIGLTLIISILICLLFGSEFVKNITDNFYEKILEINSNIHLTNIKKVLKYFIVFFIIITLITPIININTNHENLDEDKIYSVLSDSEKEEINNSFSILFVGDLILLKEQVKRGYNPKNNSYDFNDIFEYTKKDIQSANLSIGVFEGPMAGEEKGYSNSDFDDEIELYLNMPDEFGESVKNAGFDLVTLANNHIFDKGINGSICTADKLEDFGINYTGLYKSISERDNAQIIKKDNLTIGVLSYTYGLNYWTESQMIGQTYVPIIVAEDSINFEKVKKDVLTDFDILKKEKPNVIIVLPHYGTQFSHNSDSFQETWNKIFLDAGADIILGDHSHSVQPIEFKKNSDGEDAIIVNCPGNFVNSYREFDGDATAMVEVYLDKENGKLIGSAVIPMWVQATLRSNYRALPIFEILNNNTLKNEISTNDLKRVNQVFETIAEVMLGEKLKSDNSRKKLYLMIDGYKREKSKGIKLNNDSKIVQLIENASSICFIGDSITEGTKNGGYGWYEPLINSFKNKKITNVSAGGATTKIVLNMNNEFKESTDLYVIAIGTNDIRYRNSEICSMNENEFISNIGKIIDIVPKNQNTKFVIIAPWTSLENDSISKLNDSEKQEYIENYSLALEKYCNLNGYLFINPNYMIKDVFKKEQSNKYLIDFIHPNSKDGIELYSNAVMESSL